MRKISQRQFGTSLSNNMYPNQGGVVPLAGPTDTAKLDTVMGTKLFPSAREGESLSGNHWQGSWKQVPHNKPS